MPKPISLSTMWGQQNRFTGNWHAFAEIAQAAGYTHIEVSHSTDEAGLEALLHRQLLPISSLHAPTPLMHEASGRPNTHLNLAAADEAERHAAVAAHLRTIGVAADWGIHYVVVHLGWAGPGPIAAETALRRLYNQGHTSGAEVEALREAATAERRQSGRAAMDAARRSLDELAAHAGGRGVRLGLETRVGYHEMPSLDEAAELLADQDPATVGYWHDAGHAEVQHRLGLEQRERWFEVLGPRLIGCHLHDMQGITDHRAPGLGDVSWGYLARGVANAAVYTLEIDQRQPEPSLAAALTLLRREGVIG